MTNLDLAQFEDLPAVKAVKAVNAAGAEYYWLSADEDPDGYATQAGSYIYNAQLAKAVEALPALLAELRQARADNARLREALQAYETQRTKLAGFPLAYEPYLGASLEARAALAAHEEWRQSKDGDGTIDNHANEQGQDGDKTGTEPSRDAAVPVERRGEDRRGDSIPKGAAPNGAAMPPSEPSSLTAVIFAQGLAG
jgi:hypothetical protein